MPETSPIPSPPEGDRRPRRRWLSWLIPLVIVATLYGLMNVDEAATATARVDYTTFYAELEAGQVERVVLRDHVLHGTFRSERTVEDRRVTTFLTQLPPQEDAALLPLLREQGVKVIVEAAPSSPWFDALAWMVPWMLIVGLWIWFSRRAQRLTAAGNGPFAGMLGPQAKRFEQEAKVEVTFGDVAGVKAAKRDLGEIIEFLRHPERFDKLGGKMPRGVLLVGAPGTGKTLLARAVAGEAGVPFFSISGSEFIELFVGVGASRVRDLFETARRAAPAIIFIDEIDAVGRSRGTGLGGGNDEREQTLNQLLAAMDGFARSDRIVVMAATNRPDVLDPALLRPGRFDRRVVVDLPESEARRAIIDVHLRDKPLADDVDRDAIARATPGFSGADLANLVNEATLHAIRRGADRVEAVDFAAAHDKVLLGEPRETLLSAEEKRRIAVHEAGHAVAAFLLDPGSPLRQVSILPRGMALGATQQAMSGDKHLHTQSELEGRLQVLLGGHAAEKLLLGEASSGAENDLRQASDLAHRMVAQLGMSKRLGPVFHEHRTEHPFLGARIATDGGLSEATLHEIEMEARALLRTADGAVSELLEGNGERLTRLIDALLERETLDAAELRVVLEEAVPASGQRGEPSLAAVAG